MSRPSERPVVFIAEDGEGTRQLSRLVLESYGFDCHDCGDVHAAMQLIEANPRIDVLFSDIHFPGGLSGVDLAAWAMQAPRAIPVLLTSGLAAEYVEQILPEGAAFLEKPYTPEQLLQAIRSVMDSHKPVPSPA
ncbi:MAG TPA: hypothetical protein DDZ67_15165 [Xanthomonadaceae bacterium]|nr:hypothetical protein [Xanthomonadaceae bacterium]